MNANGKPRTRTEAEPRTTRPELLAPQPAAAIDQAVVVLTAAALTGILSHRDGMQIQDKDLVYRAAKLGRMAADQLAEGQ